MVQDTLDAIEYAIGSKESKWGRLRASMGHPEPFKMTYLEIGNENWGPDYEKRYNMIYKKVKELYPQIKTIANEHVEKMVVLPSAWMNIFTIQQSSLQNM